MINQVEALKMEKLNEKLQALQTELKDLYDQLDNFDCSDYASEYQYDEMLNDVYGEAEIAGSYFSTSDAIKELDPTAYLVDFLDYCNRLIRKILKSIETFKKRSKK